MTISTPDYDLAIVGAGPAGMAAATAAVECGLTCVLIDEQQAPGGQIYRSIGQSPLCDESILGADYYAGRRLLEALPRSGAVKTMFGHTLWGVEDGLVLHLSRTGEGRRLTASRLLLATGAQERPVPFPGWTLPGVMTCGAAQIALKSHALVPPAPLVLAGSGPLLLLLTAQLLRAGVKIRALLDTTPRGQWRQSLPHLMQATRNLPLLMKGGTLLRDVRRSRIPLYRHVSSLRAEGQEDRVSEVHFTSDGKHHSLDCASLLVHQGVVPNIQLSRALELDHHWHAAQQCWHPTLDSDGRSSRPEIAVAGDGGGISGAKAAEADGRMVALAIARELGRLDERRYRAMTRAPRRLRTRERSARPFLDHLYSPSRDILAPPDETLVCRCEEVTAGEIRRLARHGCPGPNQAKAYSRAGMGPCQGRLCGLTINQLIATTQKREPEEVGYYRLRMPIKPITLGELADTDSG
ncbi:MULTISPECIES: NAD(P)/FAD-dependent oxidoreductase [unclassified Halomonas]|uniref:FAD/NAD(P)-dependent oxidoreductase n=1 Tax=unclassified Halomonas TaxID=2609666 RepID=UPI0005FA1454|nr:MULTISPECIES: NAD(P)/FAD-dependent oxidoreductase [unclassified Halomonas]KJZ09994.1 (2Fe-2S)-binding protein [Halomonas sp. S2151]MCJ8287736.1 NAD(P)/FAD-dependent oxidoreductase [Halomonas sp.]MCO7216631.1 NAD(P)/FAD-dependent oxidoreductase [Halomonas sp. OfavH-34-E]NQY72455.1 FAD-dependent oxidoreductase [Halomonas sp.]